MIVLGIETATPQVGCALGGHEGVIASFHTARGRRHAEILTPAIEFTCAQAQIGLSEVGVVAVDIGPGLFTGLRVGVATAKAMAQALRVPVIGMSSLDLLAFPVRATRRLIVAVIDARRGEVFFAFYRHVPGGVQRISDPAVAKAGDVAAELEARDEEALLVGDGAVRYADVFAGLSHVEPASLGTAYPSAAALVELAQPKAQREEYVQPWELQPMYLRQADVDPAWDRRLLPGDGAGR
ncbi:MAG: tRNA (adenosine(37)-N6)-threonylcarbamoyltransferase complex dimerization subunit type 1 TsaB [Acidimicrobiales bacterium]